MIQRKLTGDQLTAARTSSRSQGLAFLLLSLIALDSAGCPASANGGDQVDTGQSMFDPEASDTSREGGRGVNGGFTLRSYDTSMGGRGGVRQVLIHHTEDTGCAFRLLTIVCIAPPPVLRRRPQNVWQECSAPKIHNMFLETY